ncbi:winged helix DNA-binding domain-containing protein, partial [Basidiobolus meristosporus CBS 931.73]
LSDLQYSDTIDWDKSGTRFIIKDPGNLASKVLPQYYETSKFASFSRQLNIYGFHRVSDRRRTKRDTNLSTIIYSHPHFRRNHPSSLHLIQRMSGPYSREKPRLPPSKASTSALVSTPPSLPSPATGEPAPHGSCESNSGPVKECTNCKHLRQEIAGLSKAIANYMMILNQPSIPEKPSVFNGNPLVNHEVPWLSDMSLPFISSYSDSFLLGEASSSFYHEHKI